MRSILGLLFFSLINFFSYSQENSISNTNEETLVRQTIDLLFEGMREGDSSKVSSVFHSNARLLTCYIDRNNNLRNSEDKLSDFLVAVGTPHEEIWNEQITSVSVVIDMHLAQVWTTYKFYLDEQFIHCGVNAFQLVKDVSGWKIMHLIDTRKTNECD